VELVGHAADVPQAIQRLLETTPDVLVLDLHLPGGTGLDVLRALRPVQPDVHVLVFTNHSHDEYRQECLTAGAEYFLDKSAEFEKIPRILRELARKKAKAPQAAR
jgi:DNA-binding NarL/FixJ family response regulator